MKNSRIAILALSLSLSPSLVCAQKPLAQKPRIPHNHASAHGGLVLMFGDYHAEIVKMQSRKELFVFLSDKMRDPQDAKDFNLEVNLIDGAKKTTLKAMIAAGGASFALPSQHSPEAYLEVKAQRKTPVRGAVTSANVEKAVLSKIPEMKPTDHSAHQGH